MDVFLVTDGDRVLAAFTREHDAREFARVERSHVEFAIVEVREQLPQRVDHYEVTMSLSGPLTSVAKGTIFAKKVWWGLDDGEHGHPPAIKWRGEKRGYFMALGYDLAALKAAAEDAARKVGYKPTWGAVERPVWEGE